MRWLYFTFFLFISLDISAVEPDCEVLKYSTNIKVAKSKKVEDVEVILRINNRSGEAHTKISIPFSKKDKLTVVEARIEDMSGKMIRKLKNSDMQDVSAISNFSLYEDDFVRKFELKHNTYPYRIYYNYKIEYNEFFYISSWSPVLDRKVPTTNAQLTITATSDYLVKYSEKNVSPCIKENLQGETRYSWKSTYDGLYKEETFSVSKSETLPHVEVVPVSFKYGAIGSHDSWKEFGNWIYKNNLGLNVLPDLEKKQVDYLLKDISNQKEKAKVLYRYLQDKTRYVNVSLGIGGMRPYPASYVATNKYGDCKALTNYLKSLYEYAGIKSFYSIIYADDKPNVLNKDLPSNQFNHVILLVPFEDDTVWLECTQQTVPFGYLGTFTQNREAFVVDNNDSKFKRTPALSLGEVKEDRIIKYNIQSKTDCSLDIQYNFRGDHFDNFNYLLSFYNKTEQEDIIRQYIPFSNFVLKDWKLSKEGRDKKEIQLHISLQSENILRNHSTEHVLNILPINLPEFEAAGKRKSEVFFPYPIFKNDSFTYSIPETLTHSVLPESKILDSKFGKYSIIVEKGEGIIKVIKSLIIPNQNIPLEQYPEFKLWIDEVIKAEKRVAIVLKNA